MEAAYATLSPPPQLTTNFGEYRGVVNCPLQLLINDYSYMSKFVFVCVQLQCMQSQTSQHLISWFPNTADNQAQRMQSESELVIRQQAGADVTPPPCHLPCMTDHLVPYPTLCHSGIICLVQYLHCTRPPKSKQQQQLLSRFAPLSVIRGRRALPTRVNLKEISSGLRRQFITIQRTHTHRVRELHFINEWVQKWSHW